MTAGSEPGPAQNIMLIGLDGAAMTARCGDGSVFLLVWTQNILRFVGN